MAKLRVLHVDDNTFVLRGIASLLKGRGYDVVSLTSIAEALEWLDDSINAWSIDLVMVDAIFADGETDGVEGLKYIRRKTVAPVVALTGIYDDPIVRQAGFDRVFRKPIEETFESEIAEVIRGARFRSKH